MDSYTLYTTKYKKELLDKLSEEGAEAWNYPINTTCYKGIYKIECKNQQGEYDLLEHLAHTLCDLAQREAVAKIVKQYLNTRDDLSIFDKREIAYHFMNQQYIARQEGISSLIFYFLYRPLLETLEAQGEINIDGWFLFRLGKYKVVLKDLLEQFVQEYLIKKDFISFIKLIREMSFLTQPLEDTLHLICEEDGGLRLLDERMKDVTSGYIKKYCQELLQDSTLSKQDLMMNILITVCPRELVIHQKDRAHKPQFIKALEGIFGLQVSYCNGCPYCH